MVKKSFLLFILLVFVFLTSGCTVVKGTIGATNGLVQGSKEGAKEDWESIQRTDAWIKANLW